MSDMTVYSFEDREGNEYGSYTTQSYIEAEQYARANKLRLIDNTYVWDESETVEDNTVCDDCGSPHAVDDKHICDDCGAEIDPEYGTGETVEPGRMRCQQCVDASGLANLAAIAPVAEETV